MDFSKNISIFDIAACHAWWSGEHLDDLAKAHLEACQAVENPKLAQHDWVKHCQYVGASRVSHFNGLTLRGILGEGRGFGKDSDNSYMQARPNWLNEFLYKRTPVVSSRKQARPAGLLNHVTSTVGVAAATLGAAKYTKYAIRYSPYYAQLAAFCGFLGHIILIVALPVAVLVGAIYGCMNLAGGKDTFMCVDEAVVSAAVIGFVLLGASLLNSYVLARVLSSLPGCAAGYLAYYGSDWVFDKVGYVAGAFSLGAQILCVGAGFGAGYIAGQFTSPPPKKAST